MRSALPAEDRRAKARDFLWIAQAGLLAEAGRARRADPEKDPTKVADYSGHTLFNRMDEAMRAAGLIPDEMTAAEAAADYCAFCAGSERSPRVPHWFARYGVEQDREDYAVVSKVDRFLWIVQTAALADAENHAGWDAKEGKPERVTPAAVIETMAQAVRAAPLIPPDMEAGDAANEFVSVYAQGMKEGRRKPPKWCRG